MSKSQLMKWSNYRKKDLRDGKARDEFYTRREDIDLMLPEWDLSDKIVYCPADSDESEFVKYFKQPGKCKELIYTSDDFRTHEDLIERCDIVVTNPPFSVKTVLRDLIVKYKKDFILVEPILPHPLDFFLKGVEQFGFRHLYKFSNTPELVNCQWFSNVGTKEHPYGYSFEELYGRPIPRVENPTPMKVFDGIPKYGKRTGFPITDSPFIVTACNNVSEFKVLRYLGTPGNVVEWRKA